MKSGSMEGRRTAGGTTRREARSRGELLAAAADAKVHRVRGRLEPLRYSAARRDGFEFFAGFGVPVDDAVPDGGDGLATGAAARSR